MALLNPLITLLFIAVIVQFLITISNGFHLSITCPVDLPSVEDPNFAICISRKFAQLQRDQISLQMHVHHMHDKLLENDGEIKSLKELITELKACCYLVDGKWSEWTDWTPCSAKCETGTQERKRQCNNPAPSHGGKDCGGDETESKDCNNDPCPACLKLILHPTPPIYNVSKHPSSIQWPVSDRHVIVGNKDQILVMSGGQYYNKRYSYLPSYIIWGYKPSTSTWTRTVTTDDHPPGLWGGCAVELEGNIYFHGGVGGDWPNNFSNDNLYIYDINEKKWRKEGGGGNGSRGSVCFGNKITNEIHEFGGYNSDGYSRDLLTYYIANGTWHNQIETTGPSPRSGMAATAVGDTVFLHGGWNSKIGIYSDFWRFNMNNMKWKKIVKAGAAKPQKRNGHSLSFLSDDVLLLAGGTSQDGSAYVYLRDVWTYRISTNEWRRHEDIPKGVLGKDGQGLSFHRATSLMNNDGRQSVYITGGYTGGLPNLSNAILEYFLC